MNELTKYDALLGELEPYTPSPLTIKKALVDAGISDMDGAYKGEDKQTVAKAAISVLKKMIVLSSDSLGKSSQSYNVGELKNRIKDLCKENDLDVSDFVEVSTIADGSNRW